MPGPTPITATHRIQLNMVVDTLPRSIHQYCDATSGGTGPSGYALINAGGGTNANFEDAVDALWALLAPFYVTPSTVFAVAYLQLYNPADGSYATIANWSTSVLPTGSAAASHGYGLIMTVYGTNRARYTLHMPEPGGTSFIRLTARASMPPALQAFYDSLTIPTPNTHLAAWSRTRGDQFLKVFVALVVGPNRKYRRQRGVA